MLNVKKAVFGVLGTAVLTTGLVSCDNDEIISDEKTTEITPKSKFGDMAYQDFLLGSSRE